MGDLLDPMEPLLAAMPAVKSPEGHVHFKNKLMWTFGILVLYFALTNIPVFGLASSSQDVFLYWRALLAGASGSIVHLGIGPIVTAQLYSSSSKVLISSILIQVRPVDRSCTWDCRRFSSLS